VALARELTVEFYLYDLGKGAKPVLSKTYKGPSRSVRRLAHKFGDDVVKYYTGEQGIFTSKIAFATTNAKSRLSHIYVMDYDGYGVYKVSRTGNQNVLPAWSPAGTIAYTSYLWRNTDLFVTPAGGGRAKRISKFAGLNTGAAFSPSGKSIALTLSKDGNAELYVISNAGKVMRRLTKNGAIDTSPTWSPDGSQIAFVSNRGGTPQIYVMGSGGGNARRLTFQGNYNQEPAWCPRKDRPLVAFTGRDEKGAYDIYTINAKTGELKRLTQGQGSNKSPTWAPSGRLIAFTSSRGGIWLMNEDGLNQHRVYRGGAQTPDWSK
jgi:TolB protein